MASLVSGIYGLAKGDPTQTEEDKLAGLSGYETGVGETDTTAASQYDLSLLSGDPTKVATAINPEVTAAKTNAQNQKKSTAEFGNRGGGTGAASEAIDDTTRGNIVSLVAGERGKSASDLSSLGSTNLSGASANINDQARLAQTAASNRQADVGDVGKGVAQIAADVATGGAAEALDKGGSTPSVTTGGDTTGGPSAFTPNTSADDDPFTPEMEAGGASDMITPFY